MGTFSLAGDFPKADDAAWRALAEKALKGADFDKALISETYDGLKIRPLYTRNNEAGIDPAGLPGSSPFTRGFSAKQAELPWHTCQLHASPSPAEANAAILKDLEGGVTAIALQVAAPGQSGVRIVSANDMDATLKDVALDLAGVWLEAGHSAAQAANMLQEVWQQRGYSNDTVIGGFGADPLGALATTGAHPLSLEQALAESVSLARATSEKYPHVTALRADARPWHGGGGSEAEELACLCATVTAYLRAMEKGGLPPRDGLGQVELALACDQDFFAGIAKLRAARALIARIADLCGASETLPSLKLHAMTSFRMFARHDPQVNILRTTIACAVAALGGANAITVLPYTYANGQPDAFARRIARNIQIVLQEESSLGAVIDPAGGSWYVEDFTRDLAEAAWKLFQEIEKQGGMAEALAKGYVQKMLAETANVRARDIAHAKAALTGVSSFANLAEDGVDLPPHPVPDEIEEPAITVEPIPVRRPAEPFERLRDAADAAAEKTGKRAIVALVPLGPERKHSERVTYARRFFAAGGLETEIVDSKAYDASASPVACLCSADDDLEADGSIIAQALKTSGATRILSVGRPGDLRKALKSASVDEFIHQGCDMIEILNDAHDVLGLKQR